MKIGTKSVLFGAHAFWLHGWFVAAAWWKLYGFPKHLWLWIAFFVHDLGYWGCDDMDGAEGERHPVFGARILYKLEHWLVYNRKWKKRMTGKWGNEVLYHSRFYARQAQMIPSNLCWADKLALSITPWWVYRWTAGLTGEIALYRASQQSGHRDAPDVAYDSDREWYRSMQRFCRKLALEQIHAPTRA